MPNEHIDVVSDFICDASSERYNRSYKAWRQKASSPCVYRYVDNKRESVYVSGKSEPRRSAAQTERRALSYSAEVIGAALLVLLVCGLGASTLLIWILRQFGVDIQIDFLTLTMRGNQWMVSAVRMLCELLKYGIPLCIIVKWCRLPRKIVLPQGFGGLSPLIAAIGFSAICSACYAVAAHDATVDSLQNIYSYKEPEAVLAYGLFDIVVVSVLSELLLRGAILPVLRQFGEPFAIAVTVVTAFLFPSELPNRVGELVIGLSASYLLLRSGSVWNCIILRIIYTALKYSSLWLIYASGTLTYIQYLLLLLCGGTVFTAVFVIRRRGRLTLKNRETALSTRAKIAAVTQTITSLPWLAGSALLMLLQLFY